MYLLTLDGIYWFPLLIILVFFFFEDIQILHKVGLDAANVFSLCLHEHDFLTTSNLNDINAF